MKEAVSVDENVCVYQCRGRASVFRTGHCVGFVVDLQGGSVEGRDMTHTHFSDTHTLSHRLQTKVIIPTLLFESSNFSSYYMLPCKTKLWR